MLVNAVRHLHNNNFRYGIFQSILKRWIEKLVKSQTGNVWIPPTVALQLKNWIFIERWTELILKYQTSTSTEHFS